MTREPLFDPTNSQTFADQRQRYDWRLLQNAHVHRVDTSGDLRTASGRLRDLGYLVHDLNASGWRTVDDLHGALAAAMSFPGHYGRNFDALNDVLRDVAEFRYGSDPLTAGTVLAIDGYDRVLDFDPAAAFHLVDVFAYVARYGLLLGHPMICLVTTAADLGKVGGTDVLWEQPPPGPG